MAIVSNNGTYADVTKSDNDKYLGTSYILTNKADFEPRKNFRLYIKNKIQKRFI